MNANGKSNKLPTVNAMAETSAIVQREWLSFLDEGEMQWDEITGNKNVRQRSESDSGDSIRSVVVAKKSRTDGSRFLKPDDVSKVMLVFDQKGGPDMHPIHIMKAIEKEIGQINHARFMGSGRILIFAKSKEQQNNILKKTSLNNLRVKSHIPGAASKIRGVISGIPVSVSMEEIMESLKEHDLIEAQQLTKGKEKTESLSVLLCFKKFLTLQWDARSLITNGQEFKRYLSTI